MIFGGRPIARSFQEQDPFKRCLIQNRFKKAGSGNRTHNYSLEDCGFTTKLYPRT